MFDPQLYSIPDAPQTPFLDPAEIREILASSQDPTTQQVNNIITKSLNLQRLSLADTATLLSSTTTEAKHLIFEAAARLKEQVYGNRIVIFAPLYIGSRCVNDCAYCGFRTSNRNAVRRTLTTQEVTREVTQLGATGQKRLILVFGEHPDYDSQFIADTTRQVYATRNDHDRINRVNINAAPLTVDGFRTVQQAGIGTYQIFQETYDPVRYTEVHPRGPKSDYDFRLTAMDRAIEAGIDDVGLGVLFGLADWRFEVMSLVRHTNHLEAAYGIGPHTISFPRIRPTSGSDTAQTGGVSDDDFKLLIAILRLAVPYAGLILTAREPADLRDELISYGISQIDAGTRLEIGGYSDAGAKQELRREQFQLSDTRSLAGVATGLVATGRIPSFCTACYRRGRTGEHFMQFATSGHIKRFCTPNALLSFAEYLEDYTDGELYQNGWQLIQQSLADVDPTLRPQTTQRLDNIRNGSRDEFF